MPTLSGMQLAAAWVRGDACIRAAGLLPAPAPVHPGHASARNIAILRIRRPAKVTEW
ncbi:hypothetical protein [Gulosibacter hominis]|uniref:hypothetical protein n=1 Tax=Gulosibacter hominis TaxID=2770504 RepID=UPI00191965D3|nr:hypothetical protein [Gulosibacter hominis]